MRTRANGPVGRIPVAFAACVLLAATNGGAAEPAVERAGWSLGTDPRGRAFLHYVPQDGGERVLTIACLRDAMSFVVYFTPPASAKEGDTTLTLASGNRTYAIDGSVSASTAGPLEFVGELDVDLKPLLAIGERLMPVLERGESVTVSLASDEGNAFEMAAETLASPAAHFRKVCFATKG